MAVGDNVTHGSSDIEWRCRHYQSDNTRHGTLVILRAIRMPNNKTRDLRLNLGFHFSSVPFPHIAYIPLIQLRRKQLRRVSNPCLLRETQSGERVKSFPETFSNYRNILNELPSLFPINTMKITIRRWTSCYEVLPCNKDWFILTI